MNGNSTVLRIRLINRIVDLVCDATVIALILISVHINLLPAGMGTAAIGFAMRALVHPSLSLGVFTRTWPEDTELKDHVQ